ncbi:hypothetical protein D3C80_1355960 [compost metagenome]
MPTAGPLTMAMVGLTICLNQTCIMAVCSSNSRFSLMKGEAVGSAQVSISAQSLMSAPAEKARPAPVTTTTLTAGSCFSSWVRARM